MSCTKKHMEVSSSLGFTLIGLDQRLAIRFLKFLSSILLLYKSSCEIDIVFGKDKRK